MIGRYVQDVRACLKHGCYFAALSLALTLPDICGMAEWPNRTVPERYIGWTNQYLSPRLAREGGQAPYLSGEVLYNLRNTFLHQGAPTIDGQKVKEARNQLDEFRLILGDGDIHSVSFTINRRDADVRIMMVNVRYLCNAICDAAGEYWRQHKDQFDFGYQVLTEAELLGEKSPLRNRLETAKEVAPPKRTPEAPKKEAAPRVSEHQLRCFFGQHFKEPRFKAQKEKIIQAVLTADNKVELNDNLTKLFHGPDVKIIHERLRPLTKALPGK